MLHLVCSSILLYLIDDARSNKNQRYCLYIRFVFRNFRIPMPIHVCCVLDSLHTIASLHKHYVLLRSYAVQFDVYRMSHELRSLLRESVPYVKVYRYNPKHLCPKLNGYGDNGKRKVWTSWGFTHYTCQLAVIYVRPCVGCHVTEFLLTVARSQELLVCSRRVIVVSFGSWYRKWRTLFRVLIICIVLVYCDNLTEVFFPCFSLSC